MYPIDVMDVNKRKKKQSKAAELMIVNKQIYSIIDGCKQRKIAQNNGVLYNTAYCQ